MTSEQLHKVLREKLLNTVKPGGGALLRTYRNLHRQDTGGGRFSKITPPLLGAYARATQNKGVVKFENVALGTGFDVSITHKYGQAHPTD